jgi:hypothetical protein
MTLSKRGISWLKGVAWREKPSRPTKVEETVGSALRYGSTVVLCFRRMLVGMRNQLGYWSDSSFTLVVSSSHVSNRLALKDWRPDEDVC